MKAGWLYCALLLLTVAGVQLATAAVQPGSDTASTMTGMELADQRMEESKKKLIGQSLKIKPDVAAKFWPVYDKYEVEHASLRRDRRRILAELGENFDAMTDAEARKYILDKMAFETRRHQITRRYILELETIMPARELARYLQIESKISAFIDAGIEEEVPLIP